MLGKVDPRLLVNGGSHSIERPKARKNMGVCSKTLKSIYVLGSKLKLPFVPCVRGWS